MIIYKVTYKLEALGVEKEVYFDNLESAEEFYNMFTDTEYPIELWVSRSKAELMRKAGIL